MKPLLSMKNVSYSYHTKKGETKALKDINFSILPSSFTSIVGPSGCGKSTLLSLIYGLLKPESGEIYIEGKPIEDSRMQMGYMLQKDNLFEWRTVYKNVLLGLEMNHKLNKQSINQVENLLKMYGLAPFKSAKPSQLSGGMRQRAALIRTLALEPDLLLLDEPFSALDYQTRLEVSDDIGNIIKSQQKTALLVTHDISEAIAMGDQVIILSNRPACIKRIINIEISSLSKDELTPFNKRQTPEFNDYFNEIWEEMSQ